VLYSPYGSVNLLEIFRRGEHTASPSALARRPSDLIAHHPVFGHFSRYRGPVEEGFEIDSFLGSRTRDTFLQQTRPCPGGFADVPYPAFDEEYFEWIALLESVTTAQGAYTMAEVGAGYGRWAVRAACAARQHCGLPFQLIAVEAEPKYFHWLRQHFRDNGIDPDRHRLIHAAVTDHCGVAPFYVQRPDDDQRPRELWFGQTIAPRPVAESLGAGEYYGFPLSKHPNGYSSITVPCLTLHEVLDGCVLVDLVDIDIQGEELRAVSAAMDLLNTKVKRLHIGTHSAQVEDGLRRLLRNNGWKPRADYGCGGVHETPYGSICFQDGVQTWINSRLVT
jgi:FkbM family methyltransferase